MHQVLCSVKMRALHHPVSTCVHSCIGALLVIRTRSVQSSCAVSVFQTVPGQSNAQRFMPVEGELLGREASERRGMRGNARGLRPAAPWHGHCELLFNSDRRDQLWMKLQVRATAST
eukprot:2032896-Rhodomonas_salina.3